MSDSVIRYDLASVLKSEIKSHQLFLEKMMPSDFPFTIHDDDDDDPSDEGESNFSRAGGVVLTGEFDGDKIHVYVFMHYCMYDYDHISNGGGDRRNRNLDLTVKISKENGKNLTFNVSASSREITVQSVSVKVPSYDADSEVKDHPVDKDSNLHSELREYLKTRGINITTADFLCKYMLWKRQRKPISVLKRLLKVI